MIVDVRRGILNHYNEDYNISFELNYNSFLNGVLLLKSIDYQKQRHAGAECDFPITHHLGKAT